MEFMSILFSVSGLGKVRGHSFKEENERDVILQRRRKNMNI